MHTVAELPCPHAVRSRAAELVDCPRRLRRCPVPLHLLLLAPRLCDMHAAHAVHLEDEVGGGRHGGLGQPGPGGGEELAVQVQLPALAHPDGLQGVGGWVGMS